jgi:uncharacterized protein YigE (DUF2233 family)
LSIERGRSVWPQSAAALFGIALLSAASAEEAGSAAACRRLAFEGKRYVACSIDVARFEIEVTWRGEGGRPFGTIGDYLRKMKSTERARLAFVMNGGMYEPDLSPVGLLIERGQQQAPVNVSPGAGNFYWKPNGVFFAGEGGVGIVEAGLFARGRVRAEHATQSGPMLVRGGRINTRMLASQSSQKIRNGVGVRDESTAIFVISEEGVSFAEFARLFRDGLSCPDALYLDGSISQLYAPSVGRTDQGNTAGPIVAAFTRATQMPAK